MRSEGEQAVNETVSLLVSSKSKKPCETKRNGGPQWNSSFAKRDKPTNDREEKTKAKSGFKLFSRMSAKQKYTLILITLATFLNSAAFSLLAPFYQTEAVKRGMNITTVGFVFGIYQFVIFLTAPFFGNYLIQLGPRFVFIAGVFVAGSCNALFGTLEYCPSGTPFIVMSLLVRAVTAFGFSGFITAGFAVVSSELKENIGFTFGILETGSGLGFMLGPTIGGALFELGGFGLPFYVAGAAILLNGIAVYKFLPDIEEPPARRQGSILTLLRCPMVFIPLCSMMVGAIGITSYDATFGRHLQSLDISVGLIGVFFGVLSFVYSIMSSIWGYISDAKNIQSPLIIMGHIVFGIGFSLVGPSTLLPFIEFNITVAIIGLACLGVSLGCHLVPTMKCMVIGAIEQGFENCIDTYAMVSGVFNSFQTLGGFIGPVGVGFLIQEYDYRGGYTAIAMCSFFMAIVTAVFFTLRRLRKKKESLVTDEEQYEASVISPLLLSRRRSWSVSMGTG